MEIWQQSDEARLAAAQTRIQQLIAATIGIAHR
jgi:hypothetical protein